MEKGRAEEERGTLGEFHVRGVLGEGGSGTVYDAEWGDRRVALKVLREELVPTPRERERFLAEAELLRAVDHPSVVKVLGAGTLPGGRPYVVMERLAGESLAARLGRGALGLADAMVCFEQLASAVSALHGRGLIHRDIKPENVILTEHHAVLLDLGIAKPEQARPSTLSQEGTLRGTPAYMAPERFFGTPASVATDVYELAVVLYMMVTGRLPWADVTDPSARLNLPRPSQVGCALPAAFETELLTGLSTRAEARPGSVAALAERLRRALVDRGGEGARDTAELPSRGEHVERSSVDSAPTLPIPRRRRRAALVGGAALTVALVSGGLWLAGRRGPEPGPGASATRIEAAPVPVTPVEEPPARIVPAVEPRPAAARVVPPSPPAARPELSPAVRELFALHPADTSVLLSGSPTQLRGSKLVKDALASPEGAAKIAELRRIGARCPDDPLAGVEAFAFGLRVGEGSALDLSARGTLARETIEHCLADLVAKGLRPAEVTRRGAVTSMANGDDTVWLAWPDAHTLLASARPTIDGEWMQARIAGQDSVRGQDALMSLLERVDTGATLWMVAAPNGPGAPLIPGTDPPLGMYASVTLTQALTLHAGLRYATTADAERNAPLLQAQLDATRQNPYGMMLLKDASFAAAGDEVIFSLAMDETTATLTLQLLIETSL